MGDPQLDKGGKDSTKARNLVHQTGISKHKGGEMLGKDDKNGVIWLYKVVHEGLSIRDCFFNDYELEHAPLGCRPKHPLIFEIKYVSEADALRVIREDENLDVNARDVDSMTALHHAVLNGYKRVVEELIKHDDIKPYLSNRRAESHASSERTQARRISHRSLLHTPKAHPSMQRVRSHHRGDKRGDD